MWNVIFSKDKYSFIVFIKVTNWYRWIFTDLEILLTSRKSRFVNIPCVIANRIYSNKMLQINTQFASHKFHVYQSLSIKTTNIRRIHQSQSYLTPTKQFPQKIFRPVNQPTWRTHNGEIPMEIVRYVRSIDRSNFKGR